MSDSFKSPEDEIRRLLGSLKGTAPEPSPFMKTRVLARLREEQRAPKDWRALALWKPLLAASASAVLLMIFWTGREARGPIFPATAGQPVAVRVEMPEAGAIRVASAQVELPSGVKFYSRSFPAIGEKKSLDLSWKEADVPRALPIVVKAEEKGLRTVRVKFFDDHKKLIGERRLKIRFESEPTQGLLPMEKRSHV